MIQTDLPFPPDDILIGRKDNFNKVGAVYLQLLIDLAGLQPEASVLEVGCGPGRIAAPLTRYLSPRGRYEGLDIVPGMITWCRREITTRYPNFHFEWANLYNGKYNPAGSITPETYRFPYADGQFDVVFLTSVFTHMLPDGFQHYLREIARVLKQGGTSLITYYLLNATAEACIADGRSRLRFPHDGDGYRTQRSDVLEVVVAYEEAYVLNRYQDAGLAVAGIHYGGWCGRVPDQPGGQDIIIGMK